MNLDDNFGNESKEELGTNEYWKSWKILTKI